MNISQLPFNQLIGLKSAETEDHLMMLPADAKYSNHIGTVHASALLAVAEAGSGELLVRKLGHIKGFVPIVRNIEAKFRKPAIGQVFARSSVSQETIDSWITQLTSRSRCTAIVPIEVVDTEGTVVLSVEVNWFISQEK